MNASFAARMRAPIFSISLFFVATTVPACTSPQAVAVCGDGVVELSEECDDGNTTAGDGCSATCRDEVAVDAGPSPDAGEGPDAPALDAPGAAPDAPGAAPDAPATDAGPVPDGAVGAACGSRGLPPCAAGLDCVFPIDAACGAAGGAGTCAPRPTLCTRELAPVCGCDGNDYSNECQAHRAGTSAAADGPCPIECDPDVVTCDGLPPMCNGGAVPRVVGGCWSGDCVPVTDCTCASNADCPGTASCNVSAGACVAGPGMAT